MMKKTEEQEVVFDQDIWSGKMSQGHSAVTKEETSKQSSRKSSKSSAQNLPMCLCLIKENGVSQDASTMVWTGSGLLLGEFTMHSFGEYPREENVSLLSQILEDCPLPKYSLSAKACTGILNRAEKRGKELPPMLKEALLRQSQPLMEQNGTATQEPSMEKTLCTENCTTHAITDVASTLRSGAGAPKHESDIKGRLVLQEYCEGIKAISFQEKSGKPGGGKGILIQNERTEVLSTLNNQSVLCLNDQGGGIMTVTENSTQTIRAQEHGHQPIVVQQTKTINNKPIVYSFDSLSSNSMKSKNPYSGCREVEISKTIDCFNPDPSKNQGGIANLCNQTKDNTTMVRLNELNRKSLQLNPWDVQSKHIFPEDGITESLCSMEAHYGGQEMYVMQNNKQQTQESTHLNQTEDIACLTDIRNLCENKNISCTTQTKNNGDFSLNYINTVHTSNFIRRLTPLECERLQGFPDGWTDIGEWIDSNGRKRRNADTPRYKALGNSIQIPFWFYFLRRISAQYERPATLGSLFDGIGGFPLCWERCNGPGTAIWASEIEEFPIAVTKKHFPEKGVNNENV